jgi:hypothetical protein
MVDWSPFAQKMNFKTKMAAIRRPFLSMVLLGAPGAGKV